MTKSLIVAYDQNRAIGANGDLPWGRSLPADLASFKKLTIGGSVIMGRKTFESIGKRALPDRENIVVSSTPTGVEKVLTALSIEAAYALARYPIFVIGGQQIYKATLPDIDTIYATEVQAVFPDTDTFFLELDENQWREVSRVHHPKDAQNDYDFDFVRYERISPRK